MRAHGVGGKIKAEALPCHPLADARDKLTTVGREEPASNRSTDPNKRRRAVSPSIRGRTVKMQSVTPSDTKDVGQQLLKPQSGQRLHPVAERSSIKPQSGQSLGQL